MDSIIATFADRIRQAAAQQQPLRLRGGGTKDFLGQAFTGEVLDTRELAGVVSYEPTELVVTARCGTPLAELQALLAQQGQCLPFDPPHFTSGQPASATVGGMVGAGLAGPARVSAGTVRDFVLGLRMLDGRGECLTFGGQVMKNVAGYDVSRLLAGSMGTLGVIAEVSLKVLPLPVADTTLAFELDMDMALQTLHRWCGQPLPLVASRWSPEAGRGRLYVRLSGAGAAVEAACRHLGGERVPQESALAAWAACRDHRLPFFSPAAPGLSLWRLSLPPVTPALRWPGEVAQGQLIEWHGAQRWLWAPADQAHALRAAAAQVGGHATMFRPATHADRTHGVYTPLSPALQAIHRNLKAALDPAGVFSPGRLLAI